MFLSISVQTCWKARQCCPLFYFVALAYRLTGVCFSAGCLLCNSLPRSFHMLWLWLSLLTHTQILHNPKAACTKLQRTLTSHSDHCHRPTLTLAAAHHKHTETHNKHIATPILPPLLLFPTPPIYIPLEQPRTPLLLLNFESAQATARNTTALELTYWIVYTDQTSAWWPQDKMYGIYFYHIIFLDTFISL